MQKELPVQSHNIAILEKVSVTKTYIMRRLFIMFFRKKKIKTSHAPMPNDSTMRQALETQHCGHCRKNCQLSAPKCKLGEEEAQIMIKKIQSD
jgi:hypothetical protein